jgi:hypothetical protein
MPEKKRIASRTWNLSLICFRFVVRLDDGCLVQNHTQQGIVDFQIAVVIDETDLPKFIHEDAHSRARSADNFGERRLADLS